MTILTGEGHLGGEFPERRTLRVARIASVAAMTIVALLLLTDLVLLLVGSAALADVFYLPLRNIPLGEHRKAVEQSIVHTSQNLPMRQYVLYLIAHAVLFALLLLVALRIGPQRVAHNDQAGCSPESTNA